MKKLVIGMAVAAGLLLLAPGAFGGAPVKYESTVFFDALSPVSGDPSMQAIDGHVTSESKKCLANRTVKITSSYGTGGTAFNRPFDTAKTGEHGGFAGVGAVSVDGNDINSSTIKLLRKSIGTKKHPKTCRGDTSGVGKH